jgi:ABC-2 type transport system ATP-binding protein
MTNDPFHIEMHLKDLNVNYNETAALINARCTLSGNTIAILGHNGAGKSTLIKTALGLLRPTSGTLQTFMTSSDPSQKIVLTPDEHMAFCPETGSVFSDITVESYIRFWCRIKHYDGMYYKKAGSKYIEIFELSPLLKRFGRELSKGQKRRVQTAIGFITNPKLFLFDEPFDGLDVQKTQELTNIIASEKHVTSFVISSHRMDVMERLADIFVVLKEGSIISYGNLQQVCEALGGSTYVIHTDRNRELLDLLRQHFKEAVLNLIGNQVTITSSVLKQQMLIECIQSNHFHYEKIETVQPTLVDAMSYHLKSG